MGSYFIARKMNLLYQAWLSLFCKNTSIGCIWFRLLCADLLEVGVVGAAQEFAQRAQPAEPRAPLRALDRRGGHGKRYDRPDGPNHDGRAVGLRTARSKAPPLKPRRVANGIN